jgi:hypothetical protein
MWYCGFHLLLLRGCCGGKARRTTQHRFHAMVGPRCFSCIMHVQCTTIYQAWVIHAIMQPDDARLRALPVIATVILSVAAWH